MTLPRLHLLLSLFVLASATRAPADTLTTLDGKAYEGQIRLESADSMTMQQAVGSAVRVKLSEVLSATFGAVGPTTRPVAVKASLEPIRGPWAARDIGAAAKEGIKRSAAKVTVNVGVLKETSDAFPFFCHPLKGDGDLVGRAADASADVAGPGFMIRGGPEPDAAFACLSLPGGMLPGRPAEWVVRPAKGQPIVTKRLSRWAPPVWVKIERDAEFVYAFVSTDGQKWTPAIDDRVALPDVAFVGVLSTVMEQRKEDQGKTMQTTFDSLRVNQSNQPVGTGLRGVYIKGLVERRVDVKPTDIKLTRVDPTIDFNWQNGSPDPAVPKETYTVRWSGTLHAPLTGRYRFFADADDEMSVYIAGQRIIQKKGEGQFNLKGGRDVPIRVDFQQRNGPAIGRLQWQMDKIPRETIPSRFLFPSSADGSGGTEDGLRGEYYSDNQLGTLAEVRQDAEINFQQDNSPAEPNRNAFSVRWTGTITAPSTGKYTFYTFSDDGVRLWVNNKQLINNWKPNPGVEDSGSIQLEADKPVPIRMESYNEAGPWTSRLMWEGPELEKQIIQSDRFAPPSTKADTRIVTRDGSELTGVAVVSMDDITLRARTLADERLISMPTDRVARITLRPMTTSMLAKLASGSVGVLLTSGDFFDGQVERASDQQLFINSLVFGPRVFNLRTDVAAIALQDVRPASAKYVVRVNNGSVYMADHVSIDGGKLTVEDRAIGKVEVPADALRGIEYGGDRVAPLDAVASTVAPAAGQSASDAMTTDGTVVGVPARLLEHMPRRAIGLASGATVTFNLDGKYRNLLCSAGVPAMLLPTASVQFVALADGKEIYRSPSRTSVDDALAISVKVTNVKTLMLKVEPAKGESGIPLPGVWADALLTKP